MITTTALNQEGSIASSEDGEDDRDSRVSFTGGGSISLSRAIYNESPLSYVGMGFFDQIYTRSHLVCTFGGGHFSLLGSVTAVSS